MQVSWQAGRLEPDGRGGRGSSKCKHKRLHKQTVSSEEQGPLVVELAVRWKFWEADLLIVSRPGAAGATSLTSQCTDRTNTTHNTQQARDRDTMWLMCGKGQPCSVTTQKRLSLVPSADVNSGFLAVFLFNAQQGQQKPPYSQDPAPLH